MSVAKAIVQLVMTVLAALVPALTAGELGPAEWINLVVIGAGVVMVYNAANIPGWSYAKLVASAVSAVAVVLTAAITDGATTSAEIIQMVLAAAAVLGVGAIPNGGVAHRTHVAG
jgi:hypothetical protein